MSEWKKVKLGDLFSIKHGYAFSGEHIIEEDNNVVLVTPGNFRIGGGFQERKCKFYDGEIPKDYILKEGDFIVTMTDLSKTIDTLGYSALVPKSDKRIYLHNQRIGLVQFKNDECDREYIYWVMRTYDYQRAIANTSTGSTVHHTSPSKICDYECVVPDKAKQHRIATILSRYDSLIENYQKQIKLLEEAAHRLYKEWFVDLRFPGYENVKMVDGLPEGWVRKTVGEVTLIKTGKKDANFGTDNGEYPFFTCAQEPIKAPSYSFDTSAVILAGNGDFNVKLYRGKFEAYQRTYVLEPDNTKMLYLLYFCISENMNKLATGASGSTIKFLTKGMIESLSIFEPSMKVVDSFNRIVEPIQSKKEHIQSQIRLLTEARDRLLPRLMGGEMELKE